jgi:UDP-3-O-[3-hydroxymyristoyl] glucosamine N-acyltransferase
VVIGEQVVIGALVVTGEQVVLGAHVVIGALVVTGAHVVMGARCLCSITRGELVVIGEQVVMGEQVVIGALACHRRAGRRGVAMTGKRLTFGRCHHKRPGRSQDRNTKNHLSLHRRSSLQTSVQKPQKNLPNSTA